MSIAAVTNSPVWCNVVKTNPPIHEGEKAHGKRTDTQRSAAVCASISFPPVAFETLELIAKEKKVSLVWVVREAAEKYIADKWPLFVKPSH